MTEQVPSRMQVVRKQDKEPRLKAFIRTELSALDADRGDMPKPRCLVVARSFDSPVMCALSAFAPELEERKIEIRAILSTGETEAGRTDVSRGLSLLSSQVRWTRNPRLIDAHEFFVLGNQASWIGDCMRRDPSKRDAFEGFRSADEKAADLAVRSFERLWSLCVPLPRMAVKAPVSTAAVDTAVADNKPGEIPAAAAQDAQQAPVPGATRH